ncbi:MAG: L-ribulose-5-phosphate 3-epimerase [Clostridia bacterium]
MRDYRLGLYEKAMPANRSFAQLLEGARDAGFDFMEISIDETEARLARLDWTREARTQLVQTMCACALPIRTMCLSGHRKYPLGSRDEQTRARALDIFQKAVHLADDLGIRIIQLAGYDVYYEQTGPDTQQLFSENLEKCVRFAAAYGVTLGFETMETPFMDTVQKALRVVQQVDSPYLGVYPDLGNLNNAALRYGHDLYADIASGAGRLFAMHLKETEPGRYRDMRFGAGCVDFARGVQAARRAGVRLFVAECWDDKSPDPQAQIQSVNDFLRNVLDA